MFTFEGFVIAGGLVFLACLVFLFWNLRRMHVNERKSREATLFVIEQLKKQRPEQE